MRPLPRAVDLDPAVHGSTLRLMAAVGFALRRTIRRWVACLALASVAPLAGCSRGMTFVMQHYDGPPRPKSSVAFIRVNAGAGPDLVAVDGEPLPTGQVLEPGNRLHIEVLPGAHQIDVEAADPITGLRRSMAVRFAAEPGKVYRVELVAGPADPAQRDSTWQPEAYEVDRETDAKIRNATAAPASTPAHPAAPAVDADSGPDAGTSPDSP